MRSDVRLRLCRWKGNLPCEPTKKVGSSCRPPASCGQQPKSFAPSAESYPRWVKILLCISAGPEQTSNSPWVERHLPSAVPSAWGMLGKSISITDAAEDAAPAMAGDALLVGW